MCGSHRLYIKRYVFLWPRCHRRYSKILQDLFVFQGKLCVQTIERAEWFVEIYYQEVLDFFLHPLNIYATSTLADVLKLALENKF